MKKSTSSPWLTILACLGLCGSADHAYGQFNYINDNPGVTFVPYGGSYTYSVTWTNGIYSVNGQLGTWVNLFYKPSGSISINALFPSTGSFSYTVPFVTSSDDGSYYLNLNGTGSSSANTTTVYMHVTPAILQEPTNTTVVNEQNTTMGLLAGPSSASSTWDKSDDGISGGLGCLVLRHNELNGNLDLLQKISNNYGYTETTPGAADRARQQRWRIHLCQQRSGGCKLSRTAGLIRIRFRGAMEPIGDGLVGTEVNTFYKPSGSLSLNTLFPSTGSFSYTVPFVTPRTMETIM